MEPAKPSPALILFRSIRSGHFNIHAMNSDGTEATALTNDTLGDGDAKWSPDGTRIVLTKSFDIYTMNPNGTGLVRLTDGFRTTPPSYSIQPAWSPDGKKIAFVTDRGSPGPGVGLMEIYVMNVDGTGVARLTDNSANDWHPSWSPDGTRIAFESDRDFNTEIYVYELQRDRTNEPD